MKRNSWLTLILPALLCIQCSDRPLPKPKAMLRLDYPLQKYVNYDNPEGCVYSFLMNAESTVRTAPDCGLEIRYDGMKGSIFLTYKPVEDNLQTLLRDAQKLSYEHMSKADQITEQPYINPDSRVFGMYYEVVGDAASQSQFYVTDSIRHFLVGSLYFESIPNYDSILPAAHYLREDIRKLMESLEWE